MALTKEDLNAVADLMDAKLGKIEGRLGKIEGRLDKIEGRLDKIESRLDRIEADVSGLKVGQNEIKKEIYMLDRKISDTYKLALDAWGLGMENRKWLEQLAGKAV